MSKKSQKTELIAIYRLEFYKKKSAWKLVHDPQQCTFKKELGKPVSNETFVISKAPVQNINQSDEHDCIWNTALMDVEPTSAEIHKEPDPSGDSHMSENESVVSECRGAAEMECDAGIPENSVRASWDRGDASPDSPRVPLCAGLSTDANASTPEWNDFFKDPQRWRVARDAPGQAEGCRCGAPDVSWAQFLLGAQRAPHSSELELRSPGDAPEEGAGEAPLPQVWCS